MFKIIIFGTGKGSLIVESALKDGVEILCYADNNQLKWGKIHNGKTIINPKGIKDIESDFIIIGSQFNEEIYKQLREYGIDDKKILCFYVFLDYVRNMVKLKLDYFLSKKDVCEVLVTGLSYIDYALPPEFSSKEMVNLANPSQDIYYDYHIIKYIFDNYTDEIKNIKRVLIGLSYYSFEYDMSLSSMRGKVPFYYEAIHVNHNFKNIEQFIVSIEKDKDIAKKILNLDETGYPIFDWDKGVEEKIIIDDDTGKQQALIDCNKKHPNTVVKNIRILKKYLNLLLNKGIEPIIIVCPVTEYYSKYFSEQMKRDFYTILDECRKHYKFKIVDCFNNKLFNIDDFYDVSHLNRNGAKKFTYLIDNILD